MLRLTTRAAFSLCLLLVAGNASARRTQIKSTKSGHDTKTLFLVARPELGDPIFKESVILMLPTSIVKAVGGEVPVIGLIVNRPARIALGEIFPDDKALQDRTETAYFGGPVDAQSPSIVFRSSKAPKQALLLFGDVYVSFDSDFIKSVLKKPGKITGLHLFLGRSQWSPDQLQNEMLVGTWYSLQAETNLIFSGSPQYLWPKLSAQADPVPVVRFPDSPLILSARLTQLH